MMKPEIRFPEFEEEYFETALSEIVERIKRKNTNLQSDIPLTISSQEGLIDQRTYFGKPIASKDMSNYYLLRNGEFAYNKSYSKGFPVGSIKRLDNYSEGALSTLYICFALKDAEIDSDYLKQYFNSSAWHKPVSEVCAEGARNHGLLNVSPDDFFSTVHFFPKSVIEQKKVAEFLNAYDSIIVNQTKKLKALELRRGGLYQQIFEKRIRLKNERGEYFPKWESFIMGDLFRERKDRASGNEELLSVTISAGVIRQKDSNKKDTSSEDKSNYKQVFNGDIAYNTMRMWQGAQGVSYWDGIVSPAYTVIIPCNNVNPEFFMLLFKSEEALNKFTVYSQGLSSDNWNLKFDTFSEIEFSVPCLEEQKVIVELFNLIDMQIKHERKKLDSMLKVKAGLLERMFI